MRGISFLFLANAYAEPLEKTHDQIFFIQIFRHASCWQQHYSCRDILHVELFSCSNTSFKLQQDTCIKHSVNAKLDDRTIIKIFDDH
jgi:hypothetical protein